VVYQKTPPPGRSSKTSKIFLPSNSFALFASTSPLAGQA
jgi:hypothetical protein